MISVEDAQALCLDLVHTGPSETVPLADGLGRTLSAPVFAKRNQPPFSASAMDGYAVQTVDVVAGAKLTIIGESAAGHGWDGDVARGEAVRIFTGAPVPRGADHVVIQENITRDGDTITLGNDISRNINIRPQGADFGYNYEVSAPRNITPADLALIAAMNNPNVSVTRRPKVALISNGDELVMPGGTPAPDQIIAS
ncbi:MAG: molybdopterin molybdotransferase MoeA, partial [Yoonia sp.]|uniref:molybdopterin molybdotransferase MoeA n=1 Tax=Yoonia sp. TaxID=2212373 RepID=UPI003EF6B833